MILLKILKINFDHKRIYGLDILRALAIVFVVLGHGSNYIPNKHFKEFVSFVEFDGVSIFFVLSGYLIGGILIKILNTSPPTFRTLFNFWVRRWLRTLPNYYFILTLLILLNYIFKEKMGHPFEGGFNVFKYYFLFSQNLNTPHPYFFQEAWSLCIEEWFYLLIPAIIFILAGVFKIKTKNAIILTAISIILLVTLFRYLRLVNSPESYLEWEIYFRKQVITRLDSIMYGVIGAFISVYYNDFWIKYKKPFLFLGIFILCIQNYAPYFAQLNSPIYQCVFSFSITSFGAVLLIPFLNEYKNGNGVIYKVITYVSLISYSMYLINLTLAQLYFVNFINRYVTHAPLILYISYWIFTLIGSVLLYKFFEKPIMDLRSKPK